LARKPNVGVIYKRRPRRGVDTPQKSGGNKT